MPTHSKITRWCLIPANNTVQIRRSFELVDRWHVTAAIYGGQMSYDVAGEIAAKKLPVLVNLKWPEAEKDADPDDEPSLRTLRFRDHAPSSPAALAKSNVKFAFYSGGITGPKDMLKAAKKSIDAGLSPDAALRALTLSPAEIFGVADRLGSIETGKIANLVSPTAISSTKKQKSKSSSSMAENTRSANRKSQRIAPKGDLTGKWKLAYTTPDGAGGSHRGSYDGDRRLAFRNVDEQARHDQHHRRQSERRQIQIQNQHSDRRFGRAT